jgi:hypothetical protein
MLGLIAAAVQDLAVPGSVAVFFEVPSTAGIPDVVATVFDGDVLHTECRPTGSPDAAARVEHFDANEGSSVGQCGCSWLDASSGAHFERSTKPDVVPYGSLMAPHLAPARSVFVM